jgi:hypothetical protein
VGVQVAIPLIRYSTANDSGDGSCGLQATDALNQLSGADQRGQQGLVGDALKYNRSCRTDSQSKTDPAKRRSERSLRGVQSHEWLYREKTA